MDSFVMLQGTQICQPGTLNRHVQTSCATVPNVPINPGTMAAVRKLPSPALLVKHRQRLPHEDLRRISSGDDTGLGHTIIKMDGDAACAS